MPLANLIWQRAIAAITLMPNAATWAEMTVLFFLLALAALPYGVRSGFLIPETAPVSAGKKWGIFAVSFISPAFMEELIFRGAPLPPVSERPTLSQIVFWSGVSLLVFVVYHPIKARLLPSLRQTPFTNPSFLLLATLMGATCTIAYLRSGSVWPPVIIHWLSVAAWLLTLGGWKRMQGDSIRENDVR